MDGFAPVDQAMSITGIHCISPMEMMTRKKIENNHDRIATAVAALASNSEQVSTVLDGRLWPVMELTAVQLVCTKCDNGGKNDL